MTFRISEHRRHRTSPQTIVCDFMRSKSRKERRTVKEAGRKNTMTFLLAGSQENAGNSEVNKTACGYL